VAVAKQLETLSVDGHISMWLAKALQTPVNRIYDPHCPPLSFPSGQKELLALVVWIDSHGISAIENGLHCQRCHDDISSNQNPLPYPLTRILAKETAFAQPQALPSAKGTAEHGGS